MQARDPAPTEISIARLEGAAEARACARLMATSEPWITLGRSFEASLSTVQDPTREVYVARDETGIAGFLILCLTGAFVGYIQTVCIDPRCRGQGLGSRLVEFAAVRAARLPGCRRAHQLHRTRTLGDPPSQDHRTAGGVYRPGPE